MHALEFHPLVEIDLTEGAQWYEAQQPGLSERFISSADMQFKRVAEQPLHYSVRFDDIRRSNLGSFPYGIFFFVESNRAVVLAVLHAARDSETVLQRRRADFKR